MKKIKAYESEESFSCSYLGDGEINALTLTESVTSIVNMLQESSIRMDPDAYIKLKVKAIKHGSFQIDLMALIGGASFVISQGLIDYAYIVVDSIAVYLKVKKFLSGDKPAAVDYGEESIVITNNSGKTQVFKNVEAVNIFLTQPIIDKNISAMFNAAAQDTTDGFEWKHGEKKLQINPGDFQNMAKYIMTESVFEPHTQVIDIELGIKKPDLAGNSQWMVYGIGKTLPVNFEDHTWIKRVHAGEIMLANGTQLRSRLRIETEIDKDGNIIEGSEKYFVEEVYDIIHHTQVQPDDNHQMTF